MCCDGDHQPFHEGCKVPLVPSQHVEARLLSDAGQMLVSAGLPATLAPGLGQPLVQTFWLDYCLKNLLVPLWEAGLGWLLVLPPSTTQCAS